MDKFEKGVLGIYLYDFKEEVQKEILKELKLKNAEEGNLDVFPIAEIPLPEEDEYVDLEKNFEDCKKCFDEHKGDIPLQTVEKCKSNIERCPAELGKTELTGNEIEELWNEMDFDINN